MQEKISDGELIGKAIDQIKYAYSHLKQVDQYNSEVVNCYHALNGLKNRLIAAKQDIRK